MRRLAFAFLLLVFVYAVPAKASDIYITQYGKGTGSSCSNPRSAAWFNTTYQASGTVVHLCGTFVGALGQRMLVARSSGITIKFESGAKLTSPVWSSMGAISIANLNHVTVDGGGTGLIQNTANGTSLGHRVTSVAVYGANCQSCTVKNITIANMYVHTSVYDTTVNQTQVNCVSFNYANNFTITGVTCHDAGWAFAGMGNNFSLSYSTAYNIDHGVAFGAYGVMSGISIHNNHIYNFAKWDTTTNAYHHDGVHLWGQRGNRIAGGAIYNNRFDGDNGVNITSYIFLQDSIQHVSVYNNVFVVLSTRYNNTLWFEASSTSLPGGPATGNSAYNNTINAGSHSRGGALMASNQLQFSSYNNVLMGGVSDVSMFYGGTIAGMNNNVYVDLGSFGDRNTFSWFGKMYQTLTQWRSVCHCDGSSKFLQPSQITIASNGQISLSSSTLASGTNLTSLASGSLSGLSTDLLGGLRPASGSWDVGAYQSDVTTAQPAPVAGATATVQ